MIGSSQVQMIDATQLDARYFPRVQLAIRDLTIKDAVLLAQKALSAPTISETAAILSSDP